MGPPFLLSLDLGVASIGWALLALDEAGNPCQLIRIGTHLFDSGNPVDFEHGKDEPPAKPRRDARQLRKMIWRRARRKRKLLRQIQRAELLPIGDVSTPTAIDAYIKAIDAQLATTWNRNITHREHQLLPYRIRAAGLGRDLSRVEFGRALYHLAQRRGFLSNRKSKEKADEKSKVKSGISELVQEMAANGSRTLGEYFASIDPEAVRVRRRWTSRKMYVDEFAQLWARQSGPLGLSEDHRQAIYDAIFFQRPLKPSDHLIGRCRHLSQHRRAPMACRLFQRFRVLQKVNDLLLVPCTQVDTPVVDKDGQLKADTNTGKPKTKKQWVPTGDGQPLTPEQRAAVLDALLATNSETMPALRKLIGAPKNHRFNFETGEDCDSSLPGHKTDARLAATIPGYTEWPDERRTALVDELLGDLEDEQMKVRLVSAYKLPPDVAAAVLDAGLEDAYAAVSRAALRRLVPLMENGAPYATARKAAFGEDEEKRPEALDRLPPVLKFNADLRNPTVLRGLTEVRKLVNLVIKRFGKPARIHIELLRALKKSRDHRAEIARTNDDRRKQRERAAHLIIRETRVARASARDIEKWLLAEECGWTCPYTGKSISPHSLFVEPQFEIEHIWPYAQSLDDSFVNKTLCHLDANREKNRRMPSQAFSDQRLEEICARVSRFTGDARDDKLRRFKATRLPEGFTNRQFNDSSHLAREASRYVGLLYGGVNDPPLPDGTAGKKRIHTRVGGLTAQLRRLWGLNQILSGTDEKTRDDHRHHAIDAVVVGCADTRTVADMMRVASEQIAWGRSRISDLPPPWPEFFHDLGAHIDRIVVSHRQSRKLGGALHAESNYSREKTIAGKKTRTIRKPVTALKESDFARIVDPRIRAAVEQAFKDSRAKSPDKAFAEARFPVWKSKPGQKKLVKRVTLISDSKPFTVGQAERARHVDSTQGSNHHARIIAKLNPDGTEKSWYDQIVTRLQMHQRKADGKNGNAQVDRSVGPNERFKFSLAANEYVELDAPGPDRKPTSMRNIYRVLAISKSHIRLVRHSDGRPRDKRKDTGDDWEPGGAGLFKHHARKVFVNYFGEVKDAGG